VLKCNVTTPNFVDWLIDEGADSYCLLLIYGSTNMSTVALCSTKSVLGSIEDSYSTFAGCLPSYII